MNQNYTISVTALPSGIQFTSGGNGDLTWIVTSNINGNNINVGSTGGLGIYNNFTFGDEVKVTANPNPGYIFQEFSSTFDGVTYSYENPTTYTYETNGILTVYFQQSSSILPSVFGVSNTEIAIVIYAVCIIGLIAGFYYLHNNNIPFAFALGLVLATILCQIINILGIYTYPIDALMIVSVVGIIIFMRH